MKAYWKTHASGAYLLLLLALTCRLTAFAQSERNLRFDRITSENLKIEKGLSQNSVNCILQDSRGYLWFGTWDGLNKFDGYEFIIYRANIYNTTNVISNQTINDIHEDQDGILWIGTEGGLNRYDRKTGRFSSFRHSGNDPFSISSDTVICIAEDEFGFMWIGTVKGLNRFDKKTGTFFRIQLNPTSANSPSNNIINCVMPDKKGNVWFGTAKGLNRYNFKSRRFSHFYHNTNDKNSISNDFIWAIIPGAGNTIWIGTDNGLDLLFTDTRRIRNFKNIPGNSASLSDNHVTALCTDSRGNLWVGTYGGGLNLFNNRDSSFIIYRNNPYDNRSVSNDYINHIYEDQSGTIWVATAWKGVNKIDLYSNKFKHFQSISTSNNSLNNNTVWGIMQDTDGSTWIATDGGINILDAERKSYKYITHQPGKSNNLIPGNLIRTVFRAANGDYWVGSFDKGISRISPTLSKAVFYSHDPKNPNSLASDEVYCIIQDKKGNIWIGTKGGLCRFNPAAGNFKRFTHKADDPFSLSENSINSVLEDKQGRLWVSTYGGINILDPRTEKFTHLPHLPGKPGSFSTDKIFSICEDREGIFWIATMGGGLNRLDPSTGIVRYYLEEQGLANNIVYNIFEDKQGFLWMSTNFGISRFDKKTETFVNYDVKDGIQSYEFNLGAAFQNPLTDEIFFGGMNGFNAFLPSTVTKNRFIPPIVITRFSIFDKPYPNEINNGDTIHLKWSDNFFAFEFSALDFSNPTKNKYAFKLENFDKQWNFCDAYKRFAGYTRVPPGTYVFRVRATNSEGIWNEGGLSVVIRISPPWWQTWWFRISAPLSFILIVIWLVWSRIRTIRIKHEDEKRILEIEKQLFSLEQTALRLQMNPHFIFNSLNSIQSFVINNDTDKAIHYLAKFAQLMRLILSNSHQSYVPVSDEIKALSIYMDIEQLRFDFKFDYNISIDKQIDDEFMEIPPMIIQPYVENAILHGILHKQERGKVDISMKLKGNFILCTVEDNGVGRKKASEIKAASDLRHKSRGMLITQKRLEILNKQDSDQVSVHLTDLYDENNIAAGTRVEIMILYREQL